MNLEDFIPVRETPQTYLKVPTFIEGEFLEAFMPAYKEVAQDNMYLLRFENGCGSSPLISGAVNKALSDTKTSLRAAVPTDNIYSEIFPMIEDKYYTELNAFDVWEQKPSYESNQELWENVIDVAREVKGSDVKFPFRLQGFFITPDNHRGGMYEVRVMPAQNARVIEDARINLPSNTKFNTLDELGMVVPDNNGKYIKWTLGNGLSVVGLYYGGSLYSDGDVIGNSSGSGRVVVVSDAASGAPKS